MTHPDKPLPRAAKGTVVRKQALVLYENEIDELYAILPHGVVRQIFTKVTDTKLSKIVPILEG